MVIFSKAGANPHINSYPYQKLLSQEHQDILTYAEPFLKSRDEESEDIKDEAREESGSEIWNRIENAKWPHILSPIKKQFSAEKSYLVLFEKATFRPMDMRSLNRFKNSMAVERFLGKSNIGHMTVGWSCAIPSQNLRQEGLTAQTGEDEYQAQEMINKGWGLTSILSTFTDGELQDGAKIQELFLDWIVFSIEKRDDYPPFLALAFEVPLEECQKVRTFVYTYINHPNRPYKNFGIAVDPLKYEGGGCGSFAISSLSNSSTWQQLSSSFWRNILIPPGLLGRKIPLELPKNVVLFEDRNTSMSEEQLAISKSSFLLANWDTPKGKIPLRFIDPELTLFAITKWAELALTERQDQPLSRNLQNRITKLVRYLQFPSHFENHLNADKDAGKHEINEDFDISLLRVKEHVDQQYASLKEQGLTPKLVSLPIGLGVLISSSP